MDLNLEQKCNELIHYLDMIPVKQECTFELSTINAGKINVQGLMNNDFIQMDQVEMGDNVETRWTIQKKDIHFFIYQGGVNLHFKLNDNIHIKALNKAQSLRIPAGIPFMLKTYEKCCSVLLLSLIRENEDAT